MGPGEPAKLRRWMGFCAMCGAGQTGTCRCWRMHSAEISQMGRSSTGGIVRAVRCWPARTFTWELTEVETVPCCTKATEPSKYEAICHRGSGRHLPRTGELKTIGS